MASRKFEASTSLLTICAAISPVIGLGILHLSAVLGATPARRPVWGKTVEDKTAVSRMVSSKRLDLITIDFSLSARVFALLTPGSLLPLIGNLRRVPPPPLIPINKDFR